MEMQGKRLLLAVGLALAVMLVWNMVFPPAKDETKKTAGSGSQVVATAPATAPVIVVTPEAPRGTEQKLVLEYPGKLIATFSSYGGALVSWQLDSKKYLKDDSTQKRGELLPARPGTGAFYVDFTSTENGVRKQPTMRFPSELDWVGTKVSETEVRYVLDTPVVHAEKIFTIVPDAYAVKMTVTIDVKVPANTLTQQSLAVSAFAYQDIKADMDGGQQIEARIWNSATFRGEEIFHTNWKDLAKAPRWEPDIIWAGYEHPYMLQAYSPRREGVEAVEKYSYAIGADGVMRTDIVFPAQKFEPGTTKIKEEVVAYLGPKSYKSLEAAEASAEFSPGFTATVDFGWFGVIGKPLLWLLLKFYAFVGNWGIAIMLLTFLVKAATMYWTTKSMRSMKAMAALAPQMKVLQEKYKEDRQRLQAETMALYKQHKVNPIAGCLPILMQMPIWIALYRMLSSAGELYQEPFISGWIDDLTTPDPFYILPIILLVTMFVQARMTPVTGDSRQQKFLQYGMPLMFGVMAFFFPSGLTLYIFTNTVLSALHSIWMNKYDKKSLAMVAQMKANAEAAAAAAAKPVGKGGAAGKSGASAKNGKPVAAKPVIDVDATAARDSGDADDDDVPEATAGGSSSSGPPRQRPRRKKRRR
ncbi:MAG: membrane protein insertase YidC [Deltaproteobacteria bacterium]|nr:membrane protein insertase YidC [Deltaproteobacteria bacterium]MDQ3295017.1 membrane protein insertase YidC [Myxococcota bacterium]